MVGSWKKLREAGDCKCNTGETVVRAKSHSRQRAKLTTSEGASALSSGGPVASKLREDICIIATTYYGPRRERLLMMSLLGGNLCGIWVLRA